MFTSEEFREPPSQDYEAAIARFYKGATVAGAGFRVSEHYILTCAHVVSQCLLGQDSTENILTADVADKPLEIDFPVARSKQRLTVKIVPELWQVNGEDIAVLKLTSPPPSPVRVITLKSDSHNYWEHRFAVYGFPKKRPDGRWVDGKLLGSQPGIDRVQMEGTRAEGLGIAPGFSGSPVWNERLAGVVGMVVARDTEESAKIGFMIPYQKLKPVLEAIILFDLLLPEAVTLAPYWDNAYKLLRPENSTESCPKTLEEAILNIQDMSAQGSDYRAIEQFIGYLSLPELGLRLQPQLLQWLEKQGADVNVLLETVRQKKQVQQAQQSAVSTPHLLFWVQEALNSDRYFAQAYLIPNREQYDPAALTGMKQLKDLAQLFEEEEDEKVSQPKLERVLQVSLNESVRELTQEQDDFPPIQVEFFLSRQCLPWQVDQWHVDEKTIYNPKPEPVGSRYRVVLRFVDRLDERRCTPQMKVLWKKKWNLLEKIQIPSAAKGLVCGENKDLATLYDELSSGEVIGWYQIQPPQPVLENDPCPFSVLVGAGAPVAIWLRQSLPKGEEDFSQLLQSCLSELPSRVKHLRKEAQDRRDKSSPHIGENIGLIWEDPKLVPPGTVQPSRMRLSA
jgi:hypothetical protein